MQFGQLHHVEYYVNDLETTKEFWGWFLSKLAFTEFQKWEDGISYAHANGTYLVFVRVTPEFQAIANNRRAAGLNHIAFQGKDEASLVEFASSLSARGIKIIIQKEYMICFEDPNRFAVEIFV